MAGAFSAPPDVVVRIVRHNFINYRVVAECGFGRPEANSADQPKLVFGDSPSR